MEKTKLKAILADLTLAEKVGQLVQVTPDFFGNPGEITGPMSQWSMNNEQLYQIGSVLGTHRSDEVKKIQRDYLANSRHKIPLIFMADVIHGYETIFPIPLALAASFDAAMIEKVAAATGAEAATEGVHVTFSPMADYVKDPRWGRVLESNGEDPRLSKVLTESYVRGYQGDNLATEENHIAACVKHFIGYGAAEGGRDYNTVDISDVEMYQNYLPAFEGAIASGVKMVMTSFNSFKGIPVTANKKLIQNVLRHELGFKGVLISDWAAIGELMQHRVAENPHQASYKAFTAGIDIDMMTDCYLQELAEIILAENLTEQLDEAVLRVLNLKNDLGLFENPYRGLKTQVDKTKLRKLAHKAALRSAVLLKNEGVLPLKKSEKILLIGTKGTTQDVLGAWSWIGDRQKAVSLADGLTAKFPQIVVMEIDDNQKDWQTVITAVKEADKVLLAVGETSDEAGEAGSRANLELSGVEQKLVAVAAQNNPATILITFSGRPLVLTQEAAKTAAIISGWFLGSEMGSALAALLSGEENFSGHLPMSFPRSVGQLPYSYQEMSTGRPKTKANGQEKYISRYLDEENGPLYAFGHGLSYSRFTFSDFSLSQSSLAKGEKATLRFTVGNDSQIPGFALPQVYFQDEVTEMIRPKIELLKWKQVYLEAGESKTISFVLSPKDFAYVHENLKRYSDPGEIQLFLATSATEIVDKVQLQLL